MNNKTLSTIGVIIGIILLGAFPTWADFDGGESAYIAEDFEAAFQEWSPLAAQGHAEAQNMLGYMYRWGQGVDQDFAKAREWPTRSADQGHSRAKNNLGMIYLHGLGVPKDNRQAFYWFIRAAEQDNAAGQNHLGLLYFKGDGVAQDYVQSSKDPRENNLTNIAPRLGLDLDGTIEKHSRHSIAMVRVFRLRPVQRWPEDWMRDWSSYFLAGPKWAFLSANQGMEPALMALPMLEEVMTPAQIEEAKQLARTWKSKGQEEVLYPAHSADDRSARAQIRSSNI